MTTAATNIGIAVVYHKSRVLVGIREAGSVLAGHAEFPGGKCGPQEPPREAAVRECLEETGLDVVAIRLLDERQHSYPHGDLNIQFWLCAPRAMDERAIQGGFRWAPLSELLQLDFPEANQHVISLLLESPKDQLNNS